MSTLLVVDILESTFSVSTFSVSTFSTASNSATLPNLITITLNDTAFFKMCFNEMLRMIAICGQSLVIRFIINCSRLNFKRPSFSQSEHLRNVFDCGNAVLVTIFRLYFCHVFYRSLKTAQTLLSLFKVIHKKTRSVYM